MPKVVYLVLAYHLPEQAIRLARTIVRGSSTAQVFLHYDAKSGYFDRSLLQETQRIELVPSPTAVEWGDWSQVEAVLGSLSYICKQTEFDWFVVLSGQDFPTRPIERFEEFLDHSEYDAYLEAQPLECVTRKSHTIARYFYRHLKIPKFSYAYRLPSSIRNGWSNLLKSLPEGKGPFTYIWAPRGQPSRIGIRAWHNPFGSDFVCWQGSDWFHLSRRAVDYLLNFLSHRPDIVHRYRNSFIPSESIYHSILFNAPELNISNSNLRFILWEDEWSASPKTLTLSDLPAIIASPAFFARKFDMGVDSEVIDEIEDRFSSSN